MADLFDRFVGSAGVLTGHTADSGDTWGPSGCAIELDGSGAIYCPRADRPAIPVSCDLVLDAAGYGLRGVGGFRASASAPWARAML